jgi:hypothetical protein
MRFVEIDGKRYAWRDILQKRREKLPARSFLRELFDPFFML